MKEAGAGSNWRVSLSNRKLSPPSSRISSFAAKAFPPQSQNGQPLLYREILCFASQPEKLQNCQKSAREGPRKGERAGVRVESKRHFSAFWRPSGVQNGKT